MKELLETLYEKEEGVTLISVGVMNRKASL